MPALDSGLAATVRDAAAVRAASDCMVAALSVREQMSGIRAAYRHIQAT
jgi:hypothetical protein